ncbi:Mitochondrial 28S ribosomal protein S31 [Cinara cedri]|uniref:Small ribosomal subunit protein mS31 n=1 Tax=Cinara cedri TaxID=506608 RepID=A0A5E4MRX2_9HEMI|nr:Mitochondrial 28S ribosomal protein S31 [Cinara cedri]
MNSSLSFKCIPYINNSKRIVIRGIYCLTRRFKSNSLPPDDDNNNNNTNSTSKKHEAIDKLNELLKTMKKGDETEIPNIELAKPRQLSKKAAQNKQKINELEQKKNLGVKLAHAATSVAESIGGDVKKTESELLNLLRIYNSECEPNNLSEKKLTSSVQLDDLLSGMKIDRSQPKVNNSGYKDMNRAERVRELIGKSTDIKQKVISYNKIIDNYVPTQLFSSKPLGIFTDIKPDKDYPSLPTWDRLYNKSLKMAATHPPKNIYEQMIIWTEQGKLWKFPIDNELGMDDEKTVFFTEHVFLEPLIDEWCPTKGPIRHFMELVCTGLSKNPFLSVKEKKDHINWFRQYFYEKNQLLTELGTCEIKSLPTDVKEYYKPTIPNE